jgi:hypothetical protein
MCSFTILLVHNKNKMAEKAPSSSDPAKSGDQVAKLNEIRLDPKRIIYSNLQSPGVVMCKDAIAPTTKYLEGQNVYADADCKYKHLPQWDVDTGSPVGVNIPLVVFVETEENMGFPVHTSWRQGEHGVYQCPSQFRNLYESNKGIQWISSYKELKQIRRAQNKYKRVAEIVVSRTTRGSKIKKVMVSILKFLRIIGVVTATGAAM